MTRRLRRQQKKLGHYCLPCNSSTHLLPVPNFQTNLRETHSGRGTWRENMLTYWGLCNHPGQSTMACVINCKIAAAPLLSVSMPLWNVVGLGAMWFIYLPCPWIWPGLGSCLDPQGTVGVTESQSWAQTPRIFTFFSSLTWNPAVWTNTNQLAEGWDA